MEQFSDRFDEVDMSMFRWVGGYAVALLLVSGCGGGSDSGAANVTPLANAGTAQSVAAGTLVTLNGSASSDTDNDPLTYAWTLTSIPAGSAALLAGATSAAPTFTVDLSGSYVASLVVNDGKVNSASATVTVTVANEAPVANAGVALNVVAGALVTLDGSASSDTNNDPLTYAWTLASRPTGSAAALSGSTSTAPTFTPDIGGTYVASLVVDDGRFRSPVSTVTITASPDSIVWALGSFDGVIYQTAAPFIASTGEYLRKIAHSAGGYSHLMTLRTDGSLSGYGSNKYGQLCGTTTTVLTNVVAVAAGYYHTVFLKSDGTVWGCGLNSFGQLGDGSLIDRSTPTQIATQAVAVAASDYTSSYLKQDGTLWRTVVLSNPTPGQVGVFVQQASNVQSIPAFSFDPVYISNTNSLIDSGVVKDTGVTKIAASSSNVYYIKADGSLWGYGSNGSGQLGNGTNIDSIAPVLMSTGVTTIGASSNLAWFLKTNGELFGVGDNRWGTFNPDTRSFPYVWTPVLITGKANSTFSSAGDSYVIFFVKDY